MEDWAKIVKTIRKNGGLTQVELGRKLGIGYSSIGSWECGHREPSMKMKKKLEEIGKELNIDYSRDIEIIRFITVLVENIPTKKLNDERLHIICGNGKDCGNLKEYICERMETLLGASVVFGEEKKG
jgi:transcriptional regulator with XRE-family HTH domain